MHVSFRTLNEPHYAVGVALTEANEVWTRGPVEIFGRGYGCPWVASFAVAPIRKVLSNTQVS